MLLFVLRLDPSGVPRRLFSPLPWEPRSVRQWSIVKVDSLSCLISVATCLAIDLQSQENALLGWNLKMPPFVRYASAFTVIVEYFSVLFSTSAEINSDR